MQMKCYSTIGPPIIEVSEGRDVVATVRITKDALASIAYETLRYAFHNNLMDDRLREAVIELAELVKADAK